MWLRQYFCVATALAVRCSNAWAADHVAEVAASHAFARRDTAPLREKLAAFMRQESVGCDSVATTTEAAQPDAEVVDLLVARGGIEPPTRGFSDR
jgi:hypothetical protein